MSEPVADCASCESLSENSDISLQAQDRPGMSVDIFLVTLTNVGLLWPGTPAETRGLARVHNEKI